MDVFGLPVDQVDNFALPVDALGLPVDIFVQSPEQRSYQLHLILHKTTPNITSATHNFGITLLSNLKLWPRGLRG